MQVGGFVEEYLSEFRIRIGQSIASSRNLGSTEENLLLAGDWICPTEIIVPSLGSDITKDGATMSAAWRSRAPNVVY